MNKIALSALCILSAPVFAGVLNEGTIVARRAQEVTVLSVKQAVISNQKVTPATPGALGYLSAVLELSLQVEGNICTSDEKYLEVLSTNLPQSWDKRLQVLTSSPFNPYPTNAPQPAIGCAAFSAPRTVVVPLGLSDYQYAQAPQSYRMLVSTGYVGNGAKDVEVLVNVTPVGYQVSVQ